METQVKAHYNTKNLRDKIFHAIGKIQDKKTDKLSLRDFAPIDQLHTGGAKATLDLLEKVNLKPGSDVLDAGCGIGGSSRLMAKKFDFIVAGMDLSDQFIQTARAISDRFFLSDQVYFQQGSILEMPFENDSFDAILCQHVLMNIEDKEKVIKEFFRVLRKNGKLILHEIVKGKNEPVMYPVPWAGQESISFLEPWEAIRSFIEQFGFKKQIESDQSQSALDWWLKAKKFSEKHKGNPPDFGPHLVFGENAERFSTSMNYNFKWDCIRAMEAVYIKG